MLRNNADIFLQRRDVVAARLFRKPAAQGFKRPDVADAGRFLDHRVNFGDRLQRIRRIERGALGEFDQHVDRIGAGELGVKTARSRHRLPLVRHLIGEPIARLQRGVDEAEAGDEQQRKQAEQPGAADHAHRDPVAEIAQRLHAGIRALEFYGEDLLVADEQYAEHRHQREHRDQRDDGGGKSGLAEFADQFGIGELQGDERYAGGTVGEYAGGTHHLHGVGEGGEFVLARDQSVARGEGELHRVREADHHYERRHHVQEHVEIETGPAETAERKQDRDDWRKGRDHHERYLAEEDNRDDTAGQNAEDVVGQPVTLDRVADLELHHGNAGELGVETTARQIVGHDLAHFADHLAEIV